MIPHSDLFDQSTLAKMIQHDALVQRYRRFFALLDWQPIQQWQAQRSTRGRPPHPESAYLKALLVKLCEGKPYVTQLRPYLLEHPLLVLELHFLPVLDPTQPYGFDVERTVPHVRWLREKQRTLAPRLLEALLHATVAALQQEIPGLGEVIAVDVKHIYA